MGKASYKFKILKRTILIIGFYNSDLSFAISYVFLPNLHRIARNIGRFYMAVMPEPITA